MSPGESRRDDPMFSDGDTGTSDAGHHDEVDPIVVDLVSTIRDRFGLRGLRSARALIDQEIVVAEEAMAELDPEP